MARRQEQEAGPVRNESRPLSPQGLPEPRSKAPIAALLVAFPPVLFYTILFRNALNIPIFDDYDAVLNFLNGLVQLRTLSARASYFLASQHCEYKLFFPHGLACLQFYLCGHVDFSLLSALANGLVLLLVILLWKIFLPAHKNLVSRLTWFIPVSWLIFQLQYWETLNFATPGLQHIAGLTFSLSTIYLLVRGERWAFYSATACLILAVSSDGNGLLIVPIGMLILTLDRRYARAVSWLVVSGGCIAAYAYRYNVMSSQIDHQRSVISLVLRFRPAYTLSFIGCAASFPYYYQAARLLLGILLCIFFIYMGCRGYIRKNPTVSYCVLFLLLSAIGATGLRSNFGAMILPSRYTIYSALFLTFAWFAIVEEFLQFSRASFLDNGIYLGAVAAALLFCLTMDMVGSTRIEGRRLDLLQAMAEFEHPIPPDSAPSPSIPLPPPPDSGGVPNLWNTHARSVLIESIKLGVYRPPPL